MKWRAPMRLPNPPHPEHDPSNRDAPSILKSVRTMIRT
jgi:hypothetical protein